MIPLPGHSFDMVGFRTPDDVVYLADCLSGEATLEKYRIGFLADAGAYLQTLEMVKQLKAKWFFPSHADAAEEIAELAQLNIDTVNEIADRIASFCSMPASFEQILKRLFEDYGLTMTFEQHALIGSTARTYLSWLTKTGRLQMQLEDNMLLWGPGGQ